MQFSSHGRNGVASVDDVLRTVTRRVEGIRRLLNNQPRVESLRQYHQDVLSLSVNFDIVGTPAPHLSKGGGGGFEIQAKISKGGGG